MKEYIRTTHNFDNKTREWEFRGDKGQDKFGIWTSPSGAKVAWFKDSDGNLLSLTE